MGPGQDMVSETGAGEGWEAFLRCHERTWMTVLGTVAVLRILLFASAFPLFANTDEIAHFDTVLKYSRGYLPRADNASYEPESAEALALYNSPEFLRPGESPVPSWRTPLEYQQWVVQKNLPFWTRARNHEASQPPVYYILAGLWYRAGEAAGLSGLALLYWLRFLNGPIFAALFYLTHRYCREHYPDDVVLRAAVAILLLAFPQDAFFTITNDILSPLAVLLALHLMLRVTVAERSLGEEMAAGAAVGLAFLVKITNATILPIALLLVLRRLVTASRAGSLSRVAPRIAALSIPLLAPVGLWLGWSAVSLGDPTGHASVAAGWTPKPFGERFDHPIFGIEGALYFGREVITTFWRGELIWHGDRLASPWADAFFVSATLVFGFAGLARLVGPGRNDALPTRLADRCGALAVALGVLFLLWVSVSFDFGGWAYPSRERPYLISGRLIGASLIPFLVLFCRGMDWAGTRLGGRHWLVVAAGLVALVALVSEFALSQSVFTSSYNFLQN